MNLSVETYSGYKADERPARFQLGERRHEVRDVLDRWYGPGYAYFKLLADDGGVYILRQDLHGGEPEWTLASYRQG